MSSQTFVFSKCLKKFEKQEYEVKKKIHGLVMLYRAHECNSL